MATNPLTDALPERARKYVYAVAALAVMVVAAVKAANGDWVEAVSIFLSSLVPALAASNTAVEE